MVTGRRGGGHVRVRAPELRGRGWLNTGGADALARRRCAARSCCSTSGRSAASTACTSWTSCGRSRRSTPTSWSSSACTRRSSRTRRDPDALAAAVERYGVHHPVLDDPELDDLAAVRRPRPGRRSSVVDPEGYVVAHDGRRGPRATRSTRLSTSSSPSTTRRARCTAATARTCRRPPPRPRCASPARRSRCRAAPSWSSDSGPPLAGRTGRRRRDRHAPHRHRRARPGRRPGRRAFTEPQGLCLLPEHVPRQVGYDVVVADTVNHALRGVRLGDRRRSRRSPAPGGSGCTADTDRRTDALAVDLSSPWDVAWYDGRVDRRDGRHPPAVVLRPGRPDGRRATPARRRGAARRAADQAWFAQPSGLSRRPTARAVDRRLRDVRAALHRRDGVMHTAVGTGLFDFGHVDGAADAGAAPAPARRRARCPTARSRSPTPTTVRCAAMTPPPTRSSTVADRARRAQRRGVLSTAIVVVVESAAHRLTRLRLPDAASAVDRSAPPHRSARHQLAPGEVVLEVVFEPPRRARSWTTRTGRRRGWWSPQPRRNCCRGAGPRHRPAPPAGARRATSARACCRSRRRRRPATTTPAASTRRATCTSRTGACRCGSSTGQKLA